MDSQWNKIAPQFLTQSEEPSSAAAENAIFLWPEILPYVADLQQGRILDFGCGTGAFCQRLYEIGFDTTGVDSAPEMLRLAREHSSPAIAYESSLLSAPGLFKGIISIHALEFINDVHSVIEELSAKVDQGGIVAIAVHAPEFIEEALKKNSEYRKVENGQAALIVGSEAIPLYVRDANFYDTVFNCLGLQRIHYATPFYTASYKTKYGIDDDVDYWAMVLIYKKTG